MLNLLEINQQIIRGISAHESLQKGLLTNNGKVGVTINININSKLAGTTMGKISFEAVVALKRAGLVSPFRTVYSARLREKSFLVCMLQVTNIAISE